MKNSTSRVLCAVVLYSAFLHPWIASAQPLPPACGGTAPGITCPVTCISCNFNGYTGSTIGYPTGPAPQFCGTVENAQWLGFIAGADKATFVITPSDCANGDGLQIALYANCTEAPLFCTRGKKGGGTEPVSIAVTMVPGNNYYLMIDGYAGDGCDFSVNVTPKEAVFEPPLGLVGVITGPDQLCPGGTGTFNVAPTPGASAYIWSGPPGAKIDTMDLPATIVGGRSVQITLGSVGGTISVQAANTCKQNPPGTSSLNIQILPESAKPKIIVDTVGHLNCNSTAATLAPRIGVAGNYRYQWKTADSMATIIGPVTGLTAQVGTLGRYNFIATDTYNGCSSSLYIQVKEPDTPRNFALRLRHVGCFGEKNGQIFIDSLKGGGKSNTYQLDDAGFSGTPEFKNLAAGQYMLTFKGENGCVADTLIEILQPDELLVDLGIDTTVLLGRRLALWFREAANDPARVRQVAFDPPELGRAVCDTCAYLPLHTFKYKVMVSDSNGCKAADERMVIVEKMRQVYIPNVFSPDGPGEGNERFRIFCGPDVARIHSLRVVNRWGNVIYAADNFTPNDDAIGWDGQFRGSRAAPELYVCLAEIEFVDGETVTVQGDLFLSR